MLLGFRWLTEMKVWPQAYPQFKSRVRRRAKARLHLLYSGPNSCVQLHHRVPNQRWRKKPNITKSVLKICRWSKTLMCLVFGLEKQTSLYRCSFPLCHQLLQTFWRFPLALLPWKGPFRKLRKLLGVIAIESAMITWLKRHLSVATSSIWITIFNEFLI